MNAFNNMVSNAITFYLNDNYIKFSPEKEYYSLLDFLRLNRELTGTKEGCGEGDCGACTVLIGRLRKCSGRDELRYESVNSCITFLPSIHASHIVSIEHLSKEGRALHPIQKELKKFNGVQCGFCTPGIVMSLYNLFLNSDVVDRNKVEESLQGNLCRCTGYGPIINAAEEIFQKYNQEMDQLFISKNKMKDRLNKIKEIEPYPNSVPKDLKCLRSLIKNKKEFTIISGATDVGIWINKDLKTPINPIFLSQIEELRTIKVSKNFITVGSSVTYTDFVLELEKYYPEITSYLQRVGGEQIRNMGTIGGNIATASPIGDMLPPLIAIKSEIIISSPSSKTRKLPIEDFFIKYRTTKLKENEFILSIKIPYPKKGIIFSNHKISKRRDEDISIICGSFYFSVKKNHIEDVRLVYGGMDEIPKRAKQTESFLLGKSWNEEVFLTASEHLTLDFNPISDARASKEYRALVAKNLLKKIFIQEFTGQTGVTRNGKDLVV